MKDIADSSISLNSLKMRMGFVQHWQLQHQQPGENTSKNHDDDEDDDDDDDDDDDEDDDGDEEEDDDDDDDDDEDDDEEEDDDDDDDDDETMTVAMRMERMKKTHPQIMIHPPIASLFWVVVSAASDRPHVVSSHFRRRLPMRQCRQRCRREKWKMTRTTPACWWINSLSKLQVSLEYQWF